MAITRSQQVKLADFPVGVPRLSDFRIVDAELPALVAGQVLCVNRYLSVDPFLRSVMAARHLQHALGKDDVIPGLAVAEVLQSSVAEFTQGDWVVGTLGWQTHAVVDAAGVQKLDASIFTNQIPRSLALGTLGMPGLTAWAGITQVAKVSANDTVLISAALGPVGSTAGQIAKALGARVIGIAGGAEKCRKVIQVFGFDACLDYKQAGFAAELKALCPKGVNVYFDNVGGAVLEAAIFNLALGARVVLCGLIDQYNESVRPPGPNLGPVIGARATLMGLVVYDFYSRTSDFLAYMQSLLKQGQLRWLEDRAIGIEQTPAMFCRLMRGENMGKALVELP